MINKKIKDICNRRLEEEASAKAILDKIRLVRKNNMYQLDRDILSLRAPVANTQAVQ